MHKIANMYFVLLLTCKLLFDITNANVGIDKLLEQIKKVFLNPHRNWVNIIIVKKENSIIKIYKKEID